MTQTRLPDVQDVEATTASRLIDLTEVASESPAESIAHENEIVEHIAHEDDLPGAPVDLGVEEQLRALIDPAEIRRR
jgi:hypothetical protein